MRLKAINHWPVAIETHSRNHPDADHYVQDVDHADPEKIVPEGYLDLLLASPECRFFSRARGGRPILDQDRMRAWTVFDWLTKLDVRAVILENVPEFPGLGTSGTRTTDPYAPRGAPPSRPGSAPSQPWATTPSTAHSMPPTLAMPPPAPAFSLSPRNDGVPIRWPEPTHSKHGLPTMHGHLPKWRGAKEILDLSNPGRSLLDDPKYRRKPLSEKTRRRIAKGIERDCGELAPYYIPLLDLPEHQDTTTDQANGSNGHRPAAEPLSLPEEPPSFILNRHGENGLSANPQNQRPLPDQHHPRRRIPAHRNHHPGTDSGTPPPQQPAGGPRLHHGQPHGEPAPATPPCPVHPITTSPGGGGLFLVRAEAMPVEHRPFLLGQHSGATPRSTEQPLPTITQDGAIALIEPSLLLYYGQSVSRNLHLPVPTILGCRKHALIEPVLVQYFGQSHWSPLNRPLPAITTHDRYALATPSLVEINHGDSLRDPRHGRSQRPDHPLPTITAKRGTALVIPDLIGGAAALMDLAHGNHHPDHRDDARRLLDLLRPLPTVTTTAAFALATPVLQPQAGPPHQALNAPVDDEAPWTAYPELTPLLVQRGQTGGNGHYVRPATNPAPTITTQSDLALATPFLVPNFGEAPNQQPRTHSIWQPLSTVTGKGACNLVVPTGRHTDLPADIDPRRLVYINGEPYLLDIRFRMLQNDELARAMGFDDEETTYEFSGTATQVTKQIGNAVPVNLAAALVRATLSPDSTPTHTQETR